MKNKKIVWLFFLLLLFVCSYSREVIFRSINALMSGEQFFYAKTTEITFLKDWSFAELNRLKYFLTLAYSVLFIGLTLLGLKVTFKQPLPFQISVGIYALVIIAALFLILFALTFSSFTAMYPFLRDLVGLIHNPILFLFMSITTFSLNFIHNEQNSGN